MNYLYSTYVSSFYYRNVDSEISDSYHHEDNILIAAESQEEAKAKVEAWVASKHRKLYRMDEPFDMPRKWFIGGWKQKQKGRKWYEEYLDEDCRLRHFSTVISLHLTKSLLKTS